MQAIPRLKKRIIKKLMKIASDHNGMLLSDEAEYKDNNSKLRYECSRHGEFKMTTHLIYKGKWCAKCKFEKLRKIHRKPWLKVVEEVKSCGWNVITKEDDYVNSSSLMVACPDGHIIKKPLSKILSGEGCHQCKAHHGENIVRLIMERIFSDPFPTKRPLFLKTANGGRLELDGYSEKLSLAFEYQGEQHYKANLFKQSDQEFAALQLRDKEKIILCQKHGVKLVIIDEIKSEILYKSDLVINLVEKCIKQVGVSIPYWDKNNFDPVRSSISEGEIHKWREISNKIGVTLDDNLWKGSSYKYNWVCQKCNHKWVASLDGRRVGSGCPECGKIKRGLSHRKYNIEALKEYALNKNGRCVSDEYKGMGASYEWECQKGHRWKALWGNVKSQNTWCPHCCTYNKKVSIGDMDVFAARKDGQCISRIYINAKTHLLWRCKEGHEFKSMPTNVQRGKWCPMCARKKRKKPI